MNCFYYCEYEQTALLFWRAVLFDGGTPQKSEWIHTSSSTCIRKSAISRRDDELSQNADEFTTASPAFQEVLGHEMNGQIVERFPMNFEPLMLET